MSTHRSIRGKPINMDEIRNNNGSVKAIGNANLNARGDLLNKKGEIIRTRESIINDYKRNNIHAVKNVSLKDKINSIPVVTPEEAIKMAEEAKKLHKQKQRKLIEDGSDEPS